MIKRTISEKEKQIIYRLQLKPVGKLKKSSKQAISHMKKINFQPERQPNIFQDQISPGAMQNMGDDQDSPFLRRRKLFKSKKAHQNQGEIIFNLIQDPRESQFSYRKYLLIEKVLLILTIFSFFVFAINTQVDTLQSSLELGDDWQISKHVNMISSFMTIILIFVMLLRYISINQLEIDQKKFYCIRTYHGFISQIHRFLKQKQSVISFLIELMMLIPHPFFLFHETKVSLFESYDQTYIFHRLNDLLTILSLFRCYIILRSVINLTVYSTPRASRLCSNNQVDHSILYSVKCLLKQQPLRIIALGFAIQLGTLGFGLKLSEGFLIYNNPDLSPTGFQNYINCYWCIFITMATVGYGDYYPKTLPGRMIGLIAAASGIILTSLLIVSLSAYLTMQTNQLKSHLTLIRLQQQKKLQEQATQAMIQTMKMTRYLSSQERQPESKIREIFTTLKYKIDLVKFRSRKIKSMVNNNNFIEQMNRLFELFKDNLQQSYENQVMLKESLNSINNQQKKQKKMRTIFLTQNMEQFIANPKA